VEIPDMVGAKDGFEEEEKSTGAAEEQDLAARMERVQMQQEQELAWERQNIDEAIAHVQMQQQYLQRRYSWREFSAEVQQQATTLESELQRLLGIKSEVEAAKSVRPMDLGKDDMIPAMRDLSGLEVSFGSGSDVSMTVGDSVLGK
jgi:predicted helicase